MIYLPKLVKLQVVYAALSLGYLLASAIRKQMTGEALSAAPAGPASILFLIYIAALFLPRFGKVGWYRIAMAIALIPFGIGGVILNITRFLDTGLAEYASVTAWAIAVVINTYGTVLNIFAALGWFRRDPDHH